MCYEESNMKLIVSGGRDYTNYTLVEKVLNQVYNEMFPKKITAVVQGGAKGADALGKRWAIENGIPYEQFDADWMRYGKAAGVMRNQEMLDESGECVVVAFPGGRGTFDMIRRAQRHNNAELIIVKDEEDELDREG